MGISPGEAHDNAIRTPRRPRSVAFPRLPQHGAVPLRSDSGLRIPPRDDTLRILYPAHHPLDKDPGPLGPRRHHKQSRQSVWLRIPRPSGLHHLPARQKLQAPPRHVPTHHRLPETVPAV